MKKQKAVSEYVKLAGMLLSIVICIFYFNIFEFLEWQNDAPAVLYLTAGMIVAYRIWLWMKRGEFKKRVFWSFTIPYWIFVLYLFFAHFRFRFDDIWYYYNSFGIFEAIIVMLPLTCFLYRYGMREKKKKAEITEIKPIFIQPVSIELAEDTIDTIKDDELLRLTLENLIEKAPTDSADEFKALQTFSEPQQAVYAIWRFETELSNGGFNHYYSILNEPFTDLLSGFLRLIGANQFADLHARANQIHKNKPSDMQHALEKLDDEFFDIYKEENIQQLQIDFIRANKLSFL